MRITESIITIWCCSPRVLKNLAVGWEYNKATFVVISLDFELFRSVMAGVAWRSDVFLDTMVAHNAL